MHFKGDALRRNGRTAEDRLNYAFALLEMAIELRVSAIERELKCTREEAVRRYRVEWERAREKKVTNWKKSLGIE
ncbi:MAG: hypothetical protein FJX76_10140 [Armatimonadetes bacterium]|nr:hypothetical protein [Armatimonadota bacterium]